MATVYKDPNVFLVEILGFTNHCSLCCSYCDWEHEPFSPLTPMELIRVRRHLELAFVFIRNHYPAAQVIEYSGGEPFVHPEVVEMILDVFQDYWVRINTNGLHIDTPALEAMKRHGRVYLALSLDGHTLEANSCRIHSQAQLDRIVNGLDTVLAQGISVALLCTMHNKNTDTFPEYLQWLEQRWPEAIRKGQLMMAAHRLSSYGKPHPSASKEQRIRMIEFLKSTDSPLIVPIREHYDRLWDRENNCTIHRWAASMHFLGDSLSTTGAFTSFRCGMRGVGTIGEFDVVREMDLDVFSRTITKSLKTDFQSYRCNCFVDWRAFDLIFSGMIPLERAKNWFLPFQSADIQNWTINYLTQQKGEGARC